MRLKLRLGRERKAEALAELTKLGVEVSEDADLILTEEGYREGTLICRDDTDRVPVPVSDVLYIESRGKEVLVNTESRQYTTSTRLYALEQELPSEKFIRISNSVIIRRDSISRIRPAFSQKFYLTLKNGAAVDVTRTYYYKFKDYYGI